MAIKSTLFLPKNTPTKVPTPAPPKTSSVAIARSPVTAEIAAAAAAPKAASLTTLPTLIPLRMRSVLVITSEVALISYL